jgi:hypothetical protein
MAREKMDAEAEAQFKHFQTADAGGAHGRPKARESRALQGLRRFQARLGCREAFGVRGFPALWLGSLRRWSDLIRAWALGRAIVNDGQAAMGWWFVRSWFVFMLLAFIVSEFRGLLQNRAVGLFRPLASLPFP